MFLTLSLLILILDELAEQFNIPPLDEFLQKVLQKNKKRITTKVKAIRTANNSENKAVSSSSSTVSSTTASSSVDNGNSKKKSKQPVKKFSSSSTKHTLGGKKSSSSSIKHSIDDRNSPVPVRKSPVPGIGNKSVHDHTPKTNGGGGTSVTPTVGGVSYAAFGGVVPSEVTSKLATNFMNNTQLLFNNTVDNN